MPNKRILEWEDGFTTKKSEQILPNGSVTAATLDIATSKASNGQKSVPRVEPSKRLFTNYIRCCAALAVILIHSSGAYLQDFDPANSLDINWWTGNIYSSLLRWATPFFIMLSGSIFLQPTRTEPTRQFLYKRIKRVIPPFAFWGLVYIAYQFRGAFFGDELPTLSAVLHKVFFEDIYYHLWFIPMITGLYFLTPVFRIFIRHARRTDIEYFLVLAFTITALQHLVPGLLIVKYIGWLGFIGFYVLGYYLVTYTLPGLLKKILYGFGLAMPVVTAIGTWWFSMRTGGNDQFLYIYFSPNVVLMTAALFTWLREFDWPAFAARYPRFNAGIERLAGLSFGVYFVHVLVLDVMKNGYVAGWYITSDMYLNHAVYPLYGALLQAATAAFISVTLIYALRKLGMNRWLM